MENRNNLRQTFPIVVWGEMEATFLPVGADLPQGIPETAALAFVMQGDLFVVADIVGRGWCILGGHIEAGETLEQAMRREAFEEAGATLGDLHPIGTYLFHYPATGKRVLVPTFWALAKEIGERPTGTESQGVRLMSREEAPSLYFWWDDLIEAVFDHALLCYRAHFS